MNPSLLPFLKHLSVFVLLWCAQAAFGQRTITGNITDGATGEALLGATVVVKEARATGTITDLNGNFSLKVPNDATALVISFTGFETVEASIAGVSTVSVQLNEGQLLKDVVVIGYGTVKREDATGLVQSVSSDKFNRGAITGPQDLLAGKIAGVVVTPGSGAPGEGATIRIRGESSLSANNDPLIVVDGIPLENGNVNGNRNQLNSINPNDIETFTVLKDASAAAIYGNRASAGVILITTKKGSSGATKIGYSANVSMGEVTKTVDVLDATEFRRAIDSLPSAQKTAALPLLGDANTNWQNEIYQKAYGTDHNLYMSGAVNRFPYRVSVGYTDKEGVLLTDHFNRFTGGVNVSPSFLNNTLQFNVNYKRMVSRNRFADRGAIGTALYMDPTQPVYDERSPYGGYWTWQEGARPKPLSPGNPVALLDLTDDRSLVNQRILSGSVDYRLPFFKALRAHLSLGLDRSNGEGRKNVPTYAAFAYNATNGGGTRNVYEAVRQNRLLENYLNYKESFGRHDFDVMVGHSWQQFREQSSSLNGSVSGKNGSEDAVRNFTGTEYFLISQFARLNYAFNQRVYLTGSVRRDGTSRFGLTNRWGLFPAGALAVKILDNKTGGFNFLKVRLGVGVTGQQEVGGKYPHLAQYQGALAGASYQFGNQYIPTTRPNGYNADLRWEETTTYNTGIDFSFFGNRISGALDVYRRDTRDLIGYVQLAALSNLTNFGDVNIGTMETKGAELALNFAILQKKNASWDLSTNVAAYENTITKLSDNPAPGYPGQQLGGIAGGVGSQIQIHTVGYQPYSFYVYKQKYDDKTGKLVEGVYEDTNGDDVVNSNDFYRFKNPAPRLSFGVTNNLRVRNFNLSFGGRLNLGNYNFDNVRSDIGYLERVYNTNGFLANTHQSALDLNVRKQSSLTFSDAFVKNASFFRMDHITLGYQLPQRITKNISLSATVQNPFVITNYDGLDPEIFRGIDNNFYPRPRTYVLGVQADF
jgi:TonB-dependent starch-binding outer membrane protein SusC